MANDAFKTGESYTLAELFSKDHQIIIPDLQRDYCWGDSCHTEERKELVSGFVRKLLELFQNNKENGELNLGLIYGYESPTNHIQLCDGQQRITTLFLLIGMLNRYSTKNAFQGNLISTYELEQDDKEPYLRYSIRESSLYFMSDLVCKIFITNGENISNKTSVSELIRKSEWYFNEYNLDPSIQSMLNAIDSIQTIIQEETIDFEEFGNFILEDLTFMYYDMQTRQKGEETFVVINTTGEPLSATQNLKPLVINADVNKEYTSTNGLAQDWEEIETWFWNHRANENDTADAGFNEFLRWLTIIDYTKDSNIAGKDLEAKKEIAKILKEGKYSFPINRIAFKDIFSMWKTLKDIAEDDSFAIENLNSFLSPPLNSNGMHIIDQNDCFKLLPILTYCNTKQCKKNNRNVQRLYRFLENLLRLDNVTKAINDLVYEVILISRNITDITDLVDESKYSMISKTILTEEEKRKIRIIRDYCDNNEVRIQIEEEFWKMQSDIILMGEILPLLDWSTQNDNFDFEAFKKYSKQFKCLFDNPNDLTRRLLLTYNVEDYPAHFSGYSNLNFATEPSHWKKIIWTGKNESIIKQLFDDLSEKSIEELFNYRCRNLTSIQKWLKPFIEKEELLTYCQHKNIRKVNEDVVILLSSVKASADYKIIFEGNDISSNNNWAEWKVWGSILYTDHKDYNIAFDVIADEESYGICIFQREQSNNKKSFNLSQYSQEISKKLTLNPDNGRYYYPNILTTNLRDEIVEIQNEIEKIINKL